MAHLPVLIETSDKNASNFLTRDDKCHESVTIPHVVHDAQKNNSYKPPNQVRRERDHSDPLLLNQDINKLLDKLLIPRNL